MIFENLRLGGGGGVKNRVSYKKRFLSSHENLKGCGSTQNQNTLKKSTFEKVGFFLVGSKKVGRNKVGRNFSHSPKITVENKGFENFA